jgi:hypothetical protein
MKKITKKRELFNEKYNEFSEVELMKEQLYKQELMNERLEKMRKIMLNYPR